MRINHLIILTSIIYITGCSSTGSAEQNSTATKIVMLADSSKINTIDASELHKSFLTSRSSSTHNGTIVEVSGRVVAFSMSEDNLYTVTIDDDGTRAVCIFDDSISGNLGDGREIQQNAVLTIQGQCFSSGLFSSTPFTLNGCRIVKK